MKIPASFRAIYEQQRELALIMQRRVDDLLKNRKNANWHYVSRVKAEESFALKLESGRVQDPNSLEDFFACTLVVRNSTEIAAAERLICDEFTPHTRRPESDDATHKNPEAFPFDDLRLYVAWRDDPQSPPTQIGGRIFEVQIKTFLQHAWAIATHDLVYKTDTPHWGKQRIAFQIKAMLEHAEVSIQQAEQLATSTGLAKSTRNSQWMSELIAMLRRVWASSDDLPTDLRRLAENIGTLCAAVDINIIALEELLVDETAAGRGAQIRNLSPFGIVLESLFRHYPRELSRALKDRRRGGKPKIVIASELELPSGSKPGEWLNGLVVKM